LLKITSRLDYIDDFCQILPWGLIAKKLYLFCAISVQLMNVAGIEEDYEMKDTVMPKVYWLKMTVDILEIKQSEIARALKLSPGQVSKLMKCEQNNSRFDRWISNQIVEKGLLTITRHDE